MPSTATTRNRLEKQAVGENSNTWGTKANTVFDIVDAALDGVEPIVTDGLSITLTNADYTADQAKNRVLNCTGIGGTIVIPNAEKVYLIRNASSGTVTISTGSGTTAAIPAGNTEWVFSTGANVVYRQFDRLLVPHEVYGVSWNGSLEVPTKNAVYDKIAAVDASVSAKMDTAGGTFTGDIVVPAEVYGAAWNGSNEAPTKNDLYDKIETLSSTTLASGTYTPTVHTVSDVTATFSALHYMRVGNTVTLGGKVILDPAAANGETSYCIISVPVNSAFTNESQAAGVGVTSANYTTRFTVKAGAANTLKLQMYAGDDVSMTFWFTATYQVI